MIAYVRRARDVVDRCDPDTLWDARPMFPDPERGAVMGAQEGAA